MNKAQKAAYKADYAQAKAEGKPFFPYAVYKDHIVASLVIGFIIFLAIWAKVEVGPEIDPATETYVPRPEWYFFFLFELLRVLKPPALVPIATVGIPTICMVLLLALPFYDRGAERIPWKRPIATITGILIIIAMAKLTLLGASAGSPSEIELATKPRYEQGKAIVAESGCLACHAIGENGAHGGLGPDLTEIGSKIPRAAIKQSVEIGPGIMPSFRGLGEEDLNAVADYLASLD